MTKVLILNGEKNSNNSLEMYTSIIAKNLKSKNYSLETVVLREKSIGHCLGCFGCWVKTPGICVINDYAQDLAQLVISSDIIIYLTPVVFGGYSYQLKKALDRMIPLISPFFTKVDGEIHHQPRYKKYPSVLGIGILSKNHEKQRQLFNDLIVRNSINTHSPSYASQVFKADEAPRTVEQSIHELIEKVSDTYEQ